MPYKDKEDKRKFQKEYRKTHRKKAKKYAKEYRQTHKEECREYFEAHKEKIENYQKKYRGTHTKQRNEYGKKRRENPKWKLTNNISRRIRQSLKKGESSYGWEKLLGYTLENLIKRLKKTLPKEMTWQDFLDGKLHIDHIIPVFAFNFDSYDDLDFRRCWALENLQLLEPTKNIKKYNKINRPFQPNLKM